ncbi:MAG: hypothetical protein IJU48_02130 [Synergistaceae bacterium]|nr:hypothetical protein [Synergistaceae bacterium]
MLRKVLSPSECAKCKFCCSHRRASLWETPRFDLTLLEKLKRKYPFAKFKVYGDYATMDLSGRYKTDDPEEEALCWFNEGKGCILGEDKFFECAIWPLSLMQKGSQLVIALAPNCKALSSKREEMQKLVDEELGEKMFVHAEKFPLSVKDYREDYYILKVKEAY